jgi:AraC family cel operon transcriptional repressor
MKTQQLRWKDYINPEMESSGSFFTSDKFLCTEHCHDFYEFCLITEGQIMHMIHGKKELLGPGSFLFIRPADTHFFEAIDDRYFQFINLAVVPKVIDELFLYLGQGFQPERFLSSPDPIRVEVPKAEIGPLQTKIEHFVLLQRYDLTLLNSELRAVLVDLFMQYFPLKLWEKKTSVPIWLDWVYKEMQKKENFAGGIATMKKIACKSPEHLCREFKKYYGKTPTEFINDTRLNYAKNLLIYSDEKIIEIAYISGFESLSHFCHGFKKKFLIPPTSYRKVYQKIIGSEKSES